MIEVLAKSPAFAASPNPSATFCKLVCSLVKNLIALCVAPATLLTPFAGG